ncbi:MAG: preprotein translocase subunit SecE [Eubacterium sp.]|nr:preprotein translocase subunit SecE [Eubacterium sp.]
MEGSKKNVQKTQESFTKGLKAEWNKIVWTDKKTLVRQTIAVVVISVIVCLLITLADNLGIQFMQLLMK